MSLTDKIKNVPLKTWGTGIALTTLGLGFLGNVFHYTRESNEGEEKPSIIKRIFFEQGEDLRSGNDLSQENLDLLTKILYFEAINEDGAEAVANVIRNRYLFDNCSPESPVKNYDCKPHFGGDKGLAGVVLEKTKVNRGNQHWVYQFSCIPENPEYFRDNLDNFEGMDPNKIEAMKRALNRALSGEYDDPTLGALYYKNSSLTNQIQERYTTWHNTEAFRGAVPKGKKDVCDLVEEFPEEANKRRSECRLDVKYVRDWTVNIDGHQFYELKPQVRTTVWDNASGKTYKGK